MTQLNIDDLGGYDMSLSIVEKEEALKFDKAYCPHCLELGTREESKIHNYRCNNEDCMYSVFIYGYWDWMFRKTMYD